MKIKILIIFLFVFAFGCRENITENIQDQLKKTMNDFLYSGENFDSSRIKYRVETVAFFEEKEYYNCEFKVRVIAPQSDTTGTMGATISKDLKTVKRKY